jgi:hypothetical protein
VPAKKNYALQHNLKIFYKKTRGRGNFISYFLTYAFIIKIVALRNLKKVLFYFGNLSFCSSLTKKYAIIYA